MEEFISIIGPSGCGKSTLLSIISGLESKTTGEIYIQRKESRRNIIRYRIYVTKRLSIRMENNMEQCNARIRTKRNKNL